MPSICYLHVLFVRYIKTTGNGQLLHGQPKSWFSACLNMVASEHGQYGKRIRDYYGNTRDCEQLSLFIGKIFGKSAALRPLEQYSWKLPALGFVPFLFSCSSH